VTRRVVHCAAGPEDAAHTRATHSISDLTTARSLCHEAGTAAPYRGRYQSVHRSVNSINTNQLNNIGSSFTEFPWLPPTSILMVIFQNWTLVICFPLERHVTPFMLLFDASAYQCSDAASSSHWVTSRQYGDRKILPAILWSSPIVIMKTRMWANAQRDGRPAEHRWRPLFNAAKFGWCPLLYAVQ